MRQEMKKLMGMKRIARGAMVVMILCLVLVFVALLLKNAGVDIADTAGVVLTVLLFAMALIYYHFHEKAKRQQAAMGVDRTPDEVAKEREKERKRVEEVNRLVSTPGAMDRRLARLARLYSFCEWNLRAGMVGMLLAIVVVLVHSLVTELPMPFIAAFATIISIALVIGMLGSFWVQKQQKKLSLHYTPEVLEAVLDRLELYDHKGSVDHGYLWEDFSFPEREWVGPCADHVKGVLKGMPLEFSEFCFQYEDVSRDDDGKIKRETRTSFNGMMVVCRHGFRLKNKVTLTQFNLFRHALRVQPLPPRPEDGEHGVQQRLVHQRGCGAGRLLHPYPPLHGEAGGAGPGQVDEDGHPVPAQRHPADRDAGCGLLRGGGIQVRGRAEGEAEKRAFGPGGHHGAHRRRHAGGDRGTAGGR